jgi:hypothetical protein
MRQVSRCVEQTRAQEVYETGESLRTKVSRQCAQEVHETGHNILLGNMYSYIFNDLDYQIRCISNLGSSKTPANLVLNLIMFHTGAGSIFI